MYKIVNAECLADKIYLMDVEAPRVFLLILISNIYLFIVLNCLEVTSFIN